MVVSAACAVLCAANIWCLVTHQPSTLHLNFVAAVFSGLGSIVCFVTAVYYE
jgi:hypothetical protein